MRKFQWLLLSISTCLLLLTSENALSCSMYKVTLNGKTMVGCNEDAWRLTSRIWFENAKMPGHYAATFTGSRWDGENGFAPQSGMNECGLVFSRLAAAAPDNVNGQIIGKQNIRNATQYLKDILHTCKTIDDVKHYVEQYDHSLFMEDVFIYIDRSGNYLVVEPYAVSIGKESKYVLSNFCPSVTTEDYALNLERYRNGIEFQNGRIDTTIGFCTALSDTMSVCRKKNNDGTLLTSIWDVNAGMVYLYFYHNYEHQVQFNLKEELAKGDHILDIQNLFPPNPDFQKLADFKIPQNNHFLLMLVVCSGVFFFCSSIFFVVDYLRTRKNTRYAFIKLLLFLLGLILFSYMVALIRNIHIFYFPAPYQDYKFTLQNVAAYIPFVLLLAIVPLLRLNIKLYRETIWRSFSKWLFTLNNLVYCTFIVLFAYWGLYSVFV